MRPEAERRNYKNVFDALTRIIKEEGVTSLWRGCVPTIFRAGLMNMGMVAPYEEVKERIDKY